MPRRTIYIVRLSYGPDDRQEQGSENGRGNSGERVSQGKRDEEVPGNKNGGERKRALDRASWRNRERESERVGLIVSAGGGREAEGERERERMVG